MKEVRTVAQRGRGNTSYDNLGENPAGSKEEATGQEGHTVGARGNRWGSRAGSQ